MAAAGPMPGMGGGEPGPSATSSLTPEQQQVVELVVNDPVLLQAILETVSQMPDAGAASPEMKGVMKSLAVNQAPVGDEMADLEKRLLGSARRGK